MGAVCSGKRPKTSDVEDTDPPPRISSKGSRISIPVDVASIEVDDGRSDFVQVEDHKEKTKTAVPIAGERKHKLPEKKEEKEASQEKVESKEKETKEIPPTTAPVTVITTAVEADPTEIQIEDFTAKKRTPISSSPRDFANDLKEDLEQSSKKRTPESRQRPPAIDFEAENESSSIQEQPESLDVKPSSKPLSTKSDISEYDSVGQMFAAELDGGVLSIELDGKKHSGSTTPFNSPTASDQNLDQQKSAAVILDGEKLSDLFQDIDVDGDSAEKLFDDDNEPETVAAEPGKVEKEVDSITSPATNVASNPETTKTDNVEAEEEEEEVEAAISSVVAKEEESVMVEPEPTQSNEHNLSEITERASAAADIDPDDVLEFEEPDEDELEETQVETPQEVNKISETIQVESKAETEEDSPGLHADDKTQTNEPEKDTKSKKEDDFVTIQPKSALEDMAEPVVLENPIDQVEEVRDERDSSPEMKLFLVSEDGRESVRLNPSEVESLQTFVKEDYSGEVEEKDREREIDPNASPRTYHSEYLRDGKVTVKRQSLSDQAIAKEEELEDIRRVMRASRSLEKLESHEVAENLNVTTSPRETNRSLSPRRSRSKSPLIERLSAKFEKPPISSKDDEVDKAEMESPRKSSQI